MEPAGPARLQGWLAAILTADITGGLRLIELNEGRLARSSETAASQLNSRIDPPSATLPSRWPRSRRHGSCSGTS
jgi:hypothetical protein